MNRTPRQARAPDALHQRASPDLVCQERGVLGRLPAPHVEPVFWPLVALFTLTPPLVLAGVRQARGCLFAVMVLPMIVCTTRSTIVGDFEPLACFTPARCWC